MKLSNQARSLIPFAAVVATVSALAGYFTETTVQTWYPGLVKPGWAPAPSVFAPVWTILYALIALSGWRIWNKLGWPKAKVPLLLFGVQLILNALWPACFFALKNTFFGALEISVLLIFVVATQVNFWREDRVAGALFIPYTVWGGYATALTWAVWSLNR